MKRSSYFIAILVILSSCKKTKMEGDLEFFVGNWEWQYTVKIHDACDPFAPDSIVIASPAISGFTYQLEIEKKGKIVISKNNKKIGRWRLVYSFDKAYAYGGRLYAFKLDNKKKKMIELIKVDEYIYTSSYPEEVFSEPNNGCYTRYSVFARK